jgi:hypothetical protein
MLPKRVRDPGGENIVCPICGGSGKGETTVAWIKMEYKFHVT